MTATPMALFGYDREAKYFYDLNKQKVKDFKETHLNVEREHNLKTCPKCGNNMDELNQYQIWIHACRSCDAITLDEADIEKLMNNIRNDETYNMFKNLVS